MTTPDEVNVLARYNAERSRGLVHTDMWQRSMVELQARFDIDMARRRDFGAHVLVPWWRRWMLRR